MCYIGIYTGVAVDKAAFKITQKQMDVTNMPKNKSQPAMSTQGGLTHTLTVALPLHVVCTQVQVNFRNGTHPPPPSPTSCLNVKRYQIGQILLITPHHKSGPPGGG